MKRRGGVGLIVVAVALLFHSIGAANSESFEVVHLEPNENASWRMGRIFSFLRPGFYYEDRFIHVETTPPGADLDLYYVRANFQKRYEQSVAPAKIVLPRRIDAGDRDNVMIRATLDGFKGKEISLRVLGKETEVNIELDELPNTLRSVAHTYFAGRASLQFLTDEALTARIQEREEGFNLIMNETAKSETLEAELKQLHGALVDEVTAQQLGEDLMIRVELSSLGKKKSLDLRARQSHDPVRDVYRYALDLIPKAGATGEVERVKVALARLRASDVTGCALHFDAALRKALDPSDLARALTPRGEYTDRYLRAAMQRLGQISAGGKVTLTDGTTYRPAAPLELAAAMSQAAVVKGYLAALRSLAAHLEGGAARVQTFQSLVAPEHEVGEFAATVKAAEAAERRCRQ